MGQRSKKQRPLPTSPFLCAAVAKGGQCTRLSNNTHCKYSHDLKAYLQQVQDDLQLPSIASLQNYTADNATSEIPLGSTNCPSFDSFGICISGYKCRFLKSHLVSAKDVAQSFQQCGWDLVFDESKMRQRAQECKSRIEGPEFVNSLSLEELKSFFYERKGELNVVLSDDQRKYRGRKDAVFPRTKAFFEILGEEWKSDKDWSNNQKKQRKNGKTQSQDTELQTEQATPERQKSPDEVQQSLDEAAAQQYHTGDARQIGENNNQTRQSNRPERDSVLPRERRTLDFRDKLYLWVVHLEAKEPELTREHLSAPLTTIGNLPFRKLCVNYGADITCGEMGLATEFLAGNSSEWALTRRDPSEKCFGIQVAGARTQQVTPAAEAIADACPDLDFIDINVGCPIDLVVKKGAGSALLEHPGKLGKSCLGLSHVIDIPYTIKLRMGFNDTKMVASNLFKKAASEWGCSASTLHGRTRAQRYTRAADYDYIRQAVEELREYEVVHDLARMPIIGNGDAYDPVTYYEDLERSGVDTIMVARGALMKPWIFTELRERRRWDISPTERLEGIQKLCRDGMMHWGSDEQGITTTRRFVLESLSFQYRYVPVGVLETLPSTLSNRPKGWAPRSDLEELLSSPLATDWRKIASFFLGPEPEGFSFTPKHKSNSEAQTQG